MGPNTCRELSALPSRTTTLSADKYSSSSRKPDKSSRKSSIFKLRYVILALICGWALYEYRYVQAPQLTTLRTQHEQLQSQLSSLQQQQSALKSQIQELQSNAFIEKYATEHYNLILPGQVPFDLGH